MISRTDDQQRHQRHGSPRRHPHDRVGRDDTNIVHVVTTRSSCRTTTMRADAPQSSNQESLVVKLFEPTPASPLPAIPEIEDRIGGTPDSRPAGPPRRAHLAEGRRGRRWFHARRTAPDGHQQRRQRHQRRAGPVAERQARRLQQRPQRGRRQRGRTAKRHRRGRQLAAGQGPEPRQPGPRGEGRRRQPATGIRSPRHDPHRQPTDVDVYTFNATAGTEIGRCRFAPCRPGDRADYADGQRALLPDNFGGRAGRRGRKARWKPPRWIATTGSTISIRPTSAIPAC